MHYSRYILVPMSFAFVLGSVCPELQSTRVLFGYLRHQNMTSISSTAASDIPVLRNKSKSCIAPSRSKYPFHRNMECN